jgi:hypothetical protein
MKYILRFIALPFFLGIHTIYAFGFMLRNAKDFMCYGGESMIHRAADQDTVHSMLQEIRDRQAMNLYHPSTWAEPKDCDNYQTNMRQFIDMETEDIKAMLHD